ncbi:MAG TPA: hypothetical protein VIJ96_01595 [Acidothermaceae bacterium]
MTGIQNLDDEPESATLALVRLAITAKCASEVGWPHTATAAARECKALADRIVIELSTACARSTAESERADAGNEPLEAALLRLYPRRVDESGEVEE